MIVEESVEEGRPLPEGPARMEEVSEALRFSLGCG
jgi:hypothetical protein